MLQRPVFLLNQVRHGFLGQKSATCSSCLSERLNLTSHWKNLNISKLTTSCQKEVTSIGNAHKTCRKTEINGCLIKQFSTSVYLLCEESKNNENAPKTERNPIIQRENIWTVPNFLTVSRIICTPFLGYLVVYDYYNAAMGLFVLAGFTDMLDGYIARNFKNQMSNFGTFLDPLADKIMITVMFATLSVAGVIPVAMTALVISRDVLLIGAASYIRYLSLKPQVTLTRYFDASIASASLHPSTLSKVNTTLQLILVTSALASRVFDFVDHPAMQVLCWITALTTFSSGAGYFLNARSYFKLVKK